MQGTDLLRVIPVIKPLGPYLTVVSIELYTAYVVVRFVDDRGFPTDSEEFAKRQLVLTDSSERRTKAPEVQATYPMA
jgi:hypothetical protein